MGELLIWLSEQYPILTVLCSLLFLTWVFFIAASVWILKTGGEASFWPPRLKGSTRIVGISGEKLKIELGMEAMPRRHEAFYENVQRSKRSCWVPVKYTEAFKQKPKIFLALSKIDVGGSKDGGPIDRLRLSTDDEHTDGFNLVFETWDDSIVYDAAASWIAVGEYLPS